MGFNDFMTKLFGNKAQRDIKAIRPFVEKINKIYPQMAALSNDELRAKTQELKQEIQASAADLRKEIDDIKAQIEKTEIQDRAPLFEKVDKLEAQILEVYDRKLDEILPTVYAIVKDTCRRFREAKSIEDLALTPTDFDREAVLRYPGVVEIVDEKVLIHEVYDGAPNIWIPYDCQLFGGVVLHQGKIAEMMTGEGKTLTSILPVFLNALTGNGVHVVTVNDYLAKRDSEWNSPVFLFHQMNVDCIDKHQPNSAARRKAYQAEVTYGTNNEFGFDYLRDNMAMRPEDLVQRSHNYAIVDEVDSVLIDDARTPLIISGPVPKGDDQMFDEFCPYIEKLVEVQRKQTTQYLSEAKKLIDSDDQKDIEAGFLSLFRAYKSLPKNKALIKYLSEPGIKTGLLKTEEIYMENNNRRMPEAVEPLYFVCDEKQKSVEMTDKGNQLIADIVKDDTFFVLPDITSQLSELEAQHLPEEEYITKKDELMQDYAVKSERVHTMQQLLKAYTMFEIDDDYVVMDGEVKIVDEQTGRIMEGRRWSDGLHQAVEAKEHVKVEAATQTYATITLQNYFRMYHKLSGMTGTAITEAGEFWDIYKLDVVEVPTNREVIRDDMNDRVYRTQREKYKAVILEVEKMRNEGRHVLVGTTSVEISEMLSKMLQMRKIPHQVLNAKLHQKEADIVAKAGTSTLTTVMVDGKPEERMLGTVTIATNMAGRGTDIKLTPEVKAAGGLAIIGTERHESRRVDRQLRGRSGRQGDPGSSVFFVSIEDKLMRLFASERIARVMDRLGFKEGEMIEHSMITRSIENAQKKVEENHFGVRKRLLEYDDVMNKQRTVIYEKRRHALMGERLGMDISDMIWDRVCNIMENNDFAGCQQCFLEIMAMEFPITKEHFEEGSLPDLEEEVYQEVLKRFGQKTEIMAANAYKVVKMVYEGPQGQMYENMMFPVLAGKRQYNIPSNLKEAYDTQARSVVTSFHKALILHTIDDAWKENLRLLDELKHSVHNASYEQKDPLLIFKLESVKLFDDMVNRINDRTVSVIMRAMVPELQPQAAPQDDPSRRERPRTQESRGELTDSGQQQAAGRDTRDRQPVQPMRAEKLPGRNDPCPCGSGLKFKNCHGKNL
ncbi:MAG: preprotein translocase subunit SecA [Bacteroidaceae bacterium]|nr:preprotein translocase subunit SecA [Bacteroidaceae bacterium]